jgi:hypothetical protein
MMDRLKFKRLKDAITFSGRKLKPFREKMREAHRQYVGTHYGDNGSEGTRPLNMLEMGVTAYLQQLASRNPQVLVNTRKSSLRIAAVECEHAINQTLLDIDFENELRNWVMQALFSVGIMKVGIQVDYMAEIDGEEIPHTSVFAESISLDDWVHDVTADKWDPQRVGFCGHKYLMTKRELSSNPNFSKNLTAKLQPRDLNEHDEMLGESDRLDEIGYGKKSTDGEYLDRIELWDIWLPEDRKVVTMSTELSEPVHEVEWEGPDRGPYHLLGFNPVLANIMPLPPIANWMDLDDLENKLINHLGRQASRQKTVTFVTQQGRKDGERVIRTNDGDTVVVDNPQNIKEARYGGIDQQTLAFALNVKGLTSYIMGNLDAMAGLGSSADTLGQEKMISATVSDRVRAMQASVVSATKDVIEDIGFWLWRSPTTQIHMARDIPGTDFAVDASWPHAADEYGVDMDLRQGDFEDYDFNIEQFSMQDLSPQIRLQTLRDIWQRDIVPLIQTGLKPDINKYLALVAKYSNMHELTDIIPELQAYSDDPQNSGGGGGGGGPHEYIRHNVSEGMTAQAQEQQQMQNLMTASAPQQQAG